GLKLGSLIGEPSEAPDGRAADPPPDGATTVGRRRDGQPITLRVAHAWTRTAAGRLLVVMARDVTGEQADTRRIQELQDELIHMDRLTALGEMGAALAHELNQPLSAAANYLAAGRRMLEKLQGEGREAVVDALDEAGEEVLRAGAVLRRLRSFIARGGPEQREVAVRELVMEAALLSRLPVREARAELKVDIEPGVGSCRVDRVQIQQVILNLVRNAAEAMDESEVRTVRIRAARSGDEVMIAVRDSGPGVPRHTAARLFEPFNTSKLDGMGVGLAISRNIIEAHGGRIWLAPDSPEGADFRFTLPCGCSREPADGG
ncbi:MAG: PAS domain-containing sensor histidine kinase, partial [Caulobacteraceae bacterium]|nr:PAS domain-containing sensor histidine kinase [Caulobacter sp.]